MEWQKLKNQNNKAKRSSAWIEKDIAFSESVGELLDVTHAVALGLTKITEDKEFLLAQSKG